MPTLKNEFWKYTNIAFLNEFTLHSPSMPSPAELRDIRIAAFSEYYLVFVNGFLSKELSNPNPGLQILSYSEAQARYPEQMGYHLNKKNIFPMNPMLAVNFLSAHAGYCIVVPKNYESRYPLNLLFINSATGGTLISPKIFFIAEENAKLDVVQTAESKAKDRIIINTNIDFYLSRDSRIGFTRIQDYPETVVKFDSNYVYQAGASEFEGLSATFGGAFTRNDAYVMHLGERCVSHLNGFYYADGKSFVDNHTYIEHAQPNCESNEFFKGILDGAATAVFNGKVKVHRIAQKTNAYQSNKNVLLSDGARINTKPELEIYADDVKCSHGATSGFIDQDAIFYLRSRGLTLERARAVLLFAFAGEILAMIKAPGLRAEIERKLASKFNAEFLLNDETTGPAK